jgi:hypothetical protein
LIVLIPILALAWELPPGLELVSADGDHVTVKDTRTGILDTYLIEGEPVINGWTLEPTEDSLVFELVAFFDMRLAEELQVTDFNENSLPELVVCNISNGGRVNMYENQGNYNFIEIYEGDPGIVYDSGDPDEDGLKELLLKLDRSIYLHEQYEYASFPDSLVWLISPLPGNYHSWPEITDLDDDGLMEISFVMHDVYRQIRIFENSGDNNYVEKPAITWLMRVYPQDFAYGDFDGDGSNEIVCGGDHGHLAIQENVADDSFEVIWEGELGHPNADLHENIGDYDQDGRDEWVSAGKDFSAGGFFFKVFDYVGNNQYESVFFDSLPGNTWDEGGISAGDVDGDGINEFLISSNNNIGLYKYGDDRGWDLVWLTDEGGSGAVLTLPFLLDIDSDSLDEIILTGSHIRTRIYDLIPTNIYQSDEQKLDIKIRAYPNPANDQITINIGDPETHKGKIHIYDILGRLVYKSPFSGQQIFWNLSKASGKGVDSGLYFISFVSIDGNIRTTIKVTILK